MKRIYCDKCGARVDDSFECLLKIGLMEIHFDLCKQCRPEAIETMTDFLKEAFLKKEIKIIKGEKTSCGNV